MSEFGNDFITLTDEDGNNVEFEHLDTLEMNNEIYMAFIEANQALEEEAEVTILKVAEENGEEILASIQDEEELNEVYAQVIKRLEEEELNDTEQILN